MKRPHKRRVAVFAVLVLCFWVQQHRRQQAAAARARPISSTAARISLAPSPASSTPARISTSSPPGQGR